MAFFPLTLKLGFHYTPPGQNPAPIQCRPAFQVQGTGKAATQPHLAALDMRFPTVSESSSILETTTKGRDGNTNQIMPLSKLR